MNTSDWDVLKGAGWRALILAAMLAAAGCGGGSDGGKVSDPAPPVAPPPVAPPPVVTPPPVVSPPQVRALQVTAEPALLAAIKDISSAEGTVAPGQPISVPEGVPGVVVAHNASDAVTAMASASATAPAISLSATETARTLAWIRMGGANLAMGIDEAKGRIDQSAQFPALVEAVRAAAQTPDGILQDPVLAAVDRLLADLRLAVPRTAASLSRSGATFQARGDYLPLSLLGLPTTDVAARRPEVDSSNIGLWNSGNLQWRAQSVPEGQTAAAYSMLLPASDGIGSFFFDFFKENIELGLSPGFQKVKVFQDDDTRRANWNAIALSAMSIVVGKIEGSGRTEAGTACMVSVVQSMMGIKMEELVGLTAVEASIAKVRMTLQGMLTPTTFNSVFSCMGKRVGRIVNPRFITSVVDTLVKGAVFKAIDGLSIANRIGTLLYYHREANGVETSACVVNGSLVAKTCDLNNSFEVNLVQVSKTVPPQTDLTILFNGQPHKIGIFCEADDSASGVQRMNILAVARSKEATTAWLGLGERPTGTYDYRTGAVEIALDTPRTVSVVGTAVTFYEQQRYRISAKVDLRTGAIKGTFTDTDVVSWNYDGTTKECTSVYAFEGGMAP